MYRYRVFDKRTDHLFAVTTNMAQAAAYADTDLEWFRYEMDEYGNVVTDKYIVVYTADHYSLGERMDTFLNWLGNKVDARFGVIATILTAAITAFGLGMLLLTTFGG